MSRSIAVTPAELSLDRNNPRFPTTAESAQAALLKIVKRDPPKALRLADHIAKNGLDPLTRIGVLERDASGLRRVVEGNRRVAALQILESPERVAAILDQRQRAALAESAAQWSARGAFELTAVEFTDNSWRPWVKLRHTGQNDGVGVVDWDSDDQGRFNAQDEGLRPAQQLLDWLERNGHPVRDDQGRIRYLTTLERVINDPDSRAQLGIDVREGKLWVRRDESAVLPALAALVDRLRSRDLRVNAVMGKQDRAREIGKLSKEFGVDRAAPSTSPGPVDALPDSRVIHTPTVTPSSTTPRRSTDRRRLIPSKVQLHIQSKRIKDLYVELRTIDVDKFTNVASVGLRVFLELSIDEFLSQTPAISVRDSDRLGVKLVAVATFLNSSDLLTNAQLKAIKAMAEKATDPLAVSTFQLNQYVHNAHIFPTPVELKRAWDHLQLFFQRLWP